METIRAERRLCSPSEFLVWFVQASRAVQAPRLVTIATSAEAEGDALGEKASVLGISSVTVRDVVVLHGVVERR